MSQNKKRIATIQDIADEAGVSPATVSRVLNNTASVNPEKELAVQRAIKKLNYSPNTTAQGLVWGRSSIIGVLAQHMGSPFFGELLHGIELGLRGSRYAPIFAVSDWDLEKDLAALDTLNRRQVDALIIIGGAIPSQELLDLAETMPIVIVGRLIKGLEQHCVYVSSFDAARHATHYLIEMGHKNIAHITGNLLHEDAVERRDGYLQALQDAHLPVHEDLIVEGDYTEPSAVLAVDKLLAKRNLCPFSAIFAANDQTAAGARLALYRRGIRVPEDISMIGFDDLPSAAYLTPPLTTIRQPAFLMGEEAAALILALLGGKEIPAQSATYELIVRESVAMR